MQTKISVEKSRTEMWLSAMAAKAGRKAYHTST
jgi:hypothetical protein